MPAAVAALRSALEKIAPAKPQSSVTLSEADLLRLLRDNATMRSQVKELQTSNTHYLERARQAEGENAALAARVKHYEGILGSGAP